MSAAQEVVAGTHFPEPVEGEGVVIQAQPPQQDVHHAEAVIVEHQLLVVHDQAALQPSGGVEHEVCARHQSGEKGVGALLR